MRWFRAKRVFGAQAALCALAIQFVLAFGHFHDIETGRDAGGLTTAAFDGARAPAPTDRGANHDGKDACALCTTIQLTGSAQPAAVPVLPVPAIYVTSAPSLASDPALDNPRSFEHRSRGPPQA